MSGLIPAPTDLGVITEAGNYQEEVNAPAIAAATLGQAFPKLCRRPHTV